MSMIQSDLLLGQEGGAGYVVERSLRFNSSDSAYLSRTPASAGNRKTWTWAGWVKRCALGSLQFLFTGTLSGSGGNSSIAFNSDDTIYFRYLDAAASFTTTAVFRDPSAWYHIVAVADTDNATANDRLAVYVNGVRQLGTISAPTLGQSNGYINFNNVHFLGTQSTTYSNFYLADVHFIDGQALTPSSFTEVSATTGQLIPKAYTGSYGTNGFRLDFSDNSAATATTLGKDYSGNNNNFTPNNFSVLTGSPVPIASATGGQPIHNTTDTFGTTIGTGVRADANASTLVLAAPLTTAGSNNLSDDESPTGRTSSIKTLTANGSITSSTSVSRYYGGAALFASGGYYALSGSDFTFGTGDFTIEAWVYNPSTTEGSLFATHPNAFATTNFNSRFYGSLQRIDIYTSGAGDYMSITGIPVDQWIHIAMCRSGGTTMRLFVNGTLRGTSNGWGMSLSDSQFFINGGRDGSGARYYQDVRVYKGLAKYSSNFVVPNAAPNPTLGAGNDSLVDTPTSYGTDTGAGGEVRGNYATWNALYKLPTTYTPMTLSNGNLDVVSPNASGIAGCPCVLSTVAASSGKYFFEVNVATAGNMLIGIAQASYIPTNEGGTGAGALSYYVNGSVFNSSNSSTAYGASYTSGNVIGVAFDADAKTCTFYKNGSSQGQLSWTFGTPVTPLIGDYGGVSTCSASANFGQRQWAYAPPAGFKALCDTNLPEGTITTSGTFTGNANADGAFVWLNGVPTAMNINGNAVTFGTHADKLANGFKLRTNSLSYNASGSNTYSITTTGAKFKYARAQYNP